ncbi:MAG: sigma-70 family RNA polymerase sigma factor [Caldilineaceae bacterium]|nr:sigma-70 family RNA polymerase sigma factor [Caldilineaceae bacterium]
MMTQETKFQVTNQRLIERCRHGDTTAWQALIDRYVRLVHSIPVRYGLAPTEVEDVGQEVFLALAQQLHQIVDPESLPAWLITTARRASWRLLQARKREQPLEDHELVDSPVADTHAPLGAQAPSLQDLFQGWQNQEVLTQGLTALGERCRQLLTLLFIDPQEPSYDEISVTLALPKGSIGPTRNRCLQQLRAILAGLGFTSITD